MTQCDVSRLHWVILFTAKKVVTVIGQLWGPCRKENYLHAYMATACAVCLLVTGACDAQSRDSTPPAADTGSLQNVTVTAFSASAKWRDVPASVAVITSATFHRFDMNSLVPAMNTVPGVRMEERSPGSYRFSIRGSLLRSPFGVRNVKMYWEEMPFTDATGNTYLQLIDVHTVRSAEIIKGPAASYYGANTGGVLILHPDMNRDIEKNVFTASLTGGSYGLFNEQVGWKYTGDHFVSNLQQGHLQNDGYRQQSALTRDVTQWNGKWDVSRHQTVTYLAFYSRLHYQTPGGITLQQMDSLPTLARQPSGSTPGAVTQQAGVYNTTAFTGVTIHSSLGSHLENATSLIGTHTDFRNPFITNYEKRQEWNYGGRTRFAYVVTRRHFSLHANAGTELQYNDSYIRVTDNDKGQPGAVQYRDRVHTTQYFLFGQLELTLHDRWSLQAGISFNHLRYWYNRLTDSVGQYPFVKTEGLTPSPRLALSYTVSRSLSVYASMAKGFSPPTLAEIRPSTGIVERGLEAEYGWNFEAGIKGIAAGNRIEYTASCYYFRLKNAIVSRTDSSGADYYVNAGGTVQKGIELWVNAHLIRNQSKNYIATLDIWNSLAYQPYRFGDYTIGTADYSGNHMTGVPRSVNVTGLDLRTRNAIYASMTLNCTAAVALNDGNTVFSKPYHLLQCRIGKTLTFSHCILDIFAGADNLFNEVYSLGNDINAFGGRYYNPAPGRNYYGGIQVKF